MGDGSGEEEATRWIRGASSRKEEAMGRKMHAEEGKRRSSIGVMVPEEAKAAEERRWQRKSGGGSGEEDAVKRKRGSAITENDMGL